MDPSYTRRGGCLGLYPTVKTPATAEVHHGFFNTTSSFEELHTSPGNGFVENNNVLLDEQSQGLGT